MDDYKLANIFDISRHINQRINSPFRSAISIYTKARNTKKSNIHTISVVKDNGFKSMYYYSPMGLYYHCPLLYNIMGKCFRDQENMY